MKNRRTIFLLLLAFAALVGAHLALRYVNRTERIAANRKTLVDVTRDFTRVIIDRRGAPSTELVKSSGWNLVRPYAGSADEQMVKRLLDALLLTPVDDALSEAELLRHGRALSDFQLDEPSFVVTLSDKSGGECVSFGSRTASGSCVYAAVEGVDAIFAVPTNVLAAVSVPSQGFRRRSLFLTDDVEVASFQIRRASGKQLALVRDGERWRVGGDLASEQKVKGFLDGLFAAEAVGFVWPMGGTNETEVVSAALLSAYGLDAEAALTVTLRGVDGEDRRVSFGADAKDSLCYALVQNETAIVTVPSELRQMADGGAVEFTDARLFPYEAPSVMTFTLNSGGIDYILSRTEVGGWRLDAPVSAPADGRAASAVLDRILALSAADLRPEGLRVAVSTNAEPMTVSGAKVLGPIRLDDLRSHVVLSVAPAFVKRLVATSSLSDAPDAVVFDRDRSVWNVEKSAKSGAVDAKGLAALLAVLNPLKSKRIEKLKVEVADLPHYGLHRPCYALAIDLDQANAVRRNILIGSRTESGDGYFATVGSSDAVFVLSAEVVRALRTPLVTN